MGCQLTFQLSCGLSRRVARGLHGGGQVKATALLKERASLASVKLHCHSLAAWRQQIEQKCLTSGPPVLL
jgi:hypothetical protein